MELGGERTAKTGCGCTGCMSMVITLLMGVLMPAVIMIIIQGSHTESDAAAIAAFEACPTITRALGTPLERVWYSPGCGEYEGGGMHAESQWTLTVRGPKGSASAWYHAEQNAGPWVVDHATIDLPAGSVAAVPCPEAAPAPAPERPSPRPSPDRSPKGGKRGKRR